MIKNIIAIALFASINYHVVAQQVNPIEQIETGKGIARKKVYRKCEIDLTTNQLLTIVRNDANLKQYYKPMATNYLGSTLLNAAGGILIAWPLTESIYKDNPNWTLAYIGAGCYLLAIPFTNAFNKHTAKAIQYYNSGYKETSSLELNLGVSLNGLGFQLTF